MKKQFLLLITALLLVGQGLAYTPNPQGRIAGNGYITGNTISMENGSFISQGFPYQGYNRLTVRGDFKDLTVKVQSSEDGFETIEEERVFMISSGGNKVSRESFEQMQGNHARYVLSADSSYTVKSVTLEKRENLFNWIWISAIILIIVGFGLYIKWKL